MGKGLWDRVGEGRKVRWFSSFFGVSFFGGGLFKGAFKEIERS